MSKRASASSNQMTAARMSSCISAQSNALGCMGSTRDKRSLSTLLLTERRVSPRRTICAPSDRPRSEEHTSELQSRQYLVCRLLLDKKKNSKAGDTLYRVIP